jgi:hypothetical protein
MERKITTLRSGANGPATQASAANYDGSKPASGWAGARIGPERSPRPASAPSVGPLARSQEQSGPVVVNRLRPASSRCASPLPQPGPGSSSAA